MSAPIENINLCFVGGVSTGKSTLLNSIFCEELTQCKIKRTTMVPTIYVECAPNVPRDETAVIFDTIAKKNADIIAKTERGQIDADDYTEMTYNVGPLDINILPDCMVNVYDIPGLNDARTKDVYYTYLRQSFHKFNLVVFMVDIHSGLNTSDEFDIVNFITTNTRVQKDTNNRSVYTLVVVNKADDMQLNEDTGTLEFTGEMREMFEQVETTITSEFQRKEVGDHLIGIIPLCAVDAYLYRMVKKYGTNFKLSREQILKIGINENGKKFSTYSSAVQEDKVMQILNDSDFIDTMIALSGFAQFENTLHEFLKKTDASHTMPIENIEYQLRQLPQITDNTAENKLAHIVGLHCRTIEKMRYVCKDKHDAHMIGLLCKVSDRIEQLAVAESTYARIIQTYKTLWTKLVYETKLQPYLFTIPSCKPIYPYGVVSRVKELFILELSSTIITIEQIQNCVDYSNEIGKLDYMPEYIDCIINNPNGVNTIAKCEKKANTQRFTEMRSMRIEELMGSLNDHNVARNKILSLLRFIIINQLHALPANKLLEKQLLFAKHGEYVILTYINNNLNHRQITLASYIEPVVDDSAHPVEMLYIGFI
jgi:GTP-binding protein EngB required for normal cell division